jgi:CubicO group peptidase (beta-lactamase class C family)
VNVGARLQAAFNASAVPGASIAVVTGDTIETASFGVKRSDLADPITSETVFDAASLSKPLFAYAVLQLIDAGVLDLDERISKYAPFVVSDAINLAPITVRHILSHTSGLPNLFGSDPFKVYFESGSRFSYASSGFFYLSRAVEFATGEPLEALMKRLVFEPLGMKSSSMIWQERFAANYAVPHEAGKEVKKQFPPTGGASGSLQTTARDYGLFIAATLSGRRLKPATKNKWLTSLINVPKDRAENLHQPSLETSPDIGWGLGWGIEQSTGSFFQWGKIDGVRAFVMGNRELNAGVVLLTNGNTGLRLIGELAGSVMPGEHPSIDWLTTCVAE